MRELIGACEVCNENIFCDSGFFDGAHVDGKLYCSNCDEKVNHGNHKDKSD